MLSSPSPIPGSQCTYRVKTREVTRHLRTSQTSNMSGVKDQRPQTQFAQKGLIAGGLGHAGAGAMELATWSAPGSPAVWIRPPRPPAALPNPSRVIGRLDWYLAIRACGKAVKEAPKPAEAHIVHGEARSELLGAHAGHPLAKPLRLLIELRLSPLYEKFASGSLHD